MSNKKGQALSSLQGIVWILVVVGIMLAIGLVVLSELRDNDAVSGDAESAINSTIDAVSEIPGWLPIIVIVIVAAIILGLVQYFKTRG